MSSPKLSCDHNLICAPGVVTLAALPHPTKSLAESALPTANLTRVPSACVAGVVPLCPRVTVRSFHLIHLIQA